MSLGINSYEECVVQSELSDPSKSWYFRQTWIQNWVLGWSFLLNISTRARRTDLLQISHADLCFEVWDERMTHDNLESNVGQDCSYTNFETLWKELVLLHIHTQHIVSLFCFYPCPFSTISTHFCNPFPTAFFLRYEYLSRQSLSVSLPFSSSFKSGIWKQPFIAQVFP